MRLVFNSMLYALCSMLYDLLGHLHSVFGPFDKLRAVSQSNGPSE